MSTPEEKAMEQRLIERLHARFDPRVFAAQHGLRWIDASEGSKQGFYAENQGFYDVPVVDEIDYDDVKAWLATLND